VEEVRRGCGGVDSSARKEVLDSAQGGHVGCVCSPRCWGLHVGIRIWGIYPEMPWKVMMASILQLAVEGEGELTASGQEVRRPGGP
jgi:hypothetical protein